MTTEAYPCLISDPTVFNKCVSNLVARNFLTISGTYEFHDCFTLDPDDYAILHPPSVPPHSEVVALIFLYSLTPKQSERKICGIVPPDVLGGKKIKFMKQFVKDSCGVVAIAHCFANLPNCTFKTFVSDDDPEANGRAFESDRGLRDCVLETAESCNLPSHAEEATTHFIAFLPINGNLYELDGRLPGAVNHGTTCSDTWVQMALRVIGKEIVALEPDQTNYNLQRLIRINN